MQTQAMHLKNDFQPMPEDAPMFDMGRMRFNGFDEDQQFLTDTLDYYSISLEYDSFSFD